MLGLLPLISQLGDLASVHLDLLGLEGETLHKVEVHVTDEGPQNPEEGLFVLIVGLGGDVEVLKVALAVEGDLAGFDLAVLLVDLVANQHDGDVIADSGKVLVPLGNVLVGDTGGDIEHQNCRVGTDVITLTEATEFLLAGGVPEGETDGAVVGVEDDGTNLDALGGDVFLLELSGDVPLDEGGLADTAVADQDDLELSNWLDCLPLNIVTSIS